MNIRILIAFALAALVICPMANAAPHKSPAKITSEKSLSALNADDLALPFPKNATILFQGDSITDGGRWPGGDPNHGLGQDYAYIIAARCGAHFPDQNWTFLNRGVGGNRSEDLAARWQSDALALKPDILSIAIGVNDAWSIASPIPALLAPSTADQFEQAYDQILSQSLAANPKIKFVLCEPFIEMVGHPTSNPALWTSEIKKRQEVVERLAIKYHAPVVHFQTVLDTAIAHSTQPITYWVWDGVHPTYAGHELMAEEWLRTVRQFYGTEVDR